MDISFWQTVSTWAVRGLLVSGIFTAVFVFFMKIADDKIKEFYRSQENERQHGISIKLSRIDKRIEILDSLPGLLKRDDDPTKDDTLRKTAYEKYKSEQYLESLIDINKAIALDDKNPKNYLVRAYVYSKLYDSFGPGGLVSVFDKVRDKYAREWYEKGVKDYQKVIDLTKNKEEDFYIDAKCRLSHFQAVRGLHSDQKESDKYFSEARNNIAELSSEYPLNLQVAAYSKLVNKLVALSKEDWGLQ